MRKVFHVAVNSAWFKKSQRKWDFLLRLSVSSWILLFAYCRRIFTSNCPHSLRYFSRGEPHCVWDRFLRAAFEHFRFIHFYLSTCHSGRVFFPVKTEELSNCKIRGRPMPPDIPFLPMTEPRCHSAHLWVAGGHLHTASPGRPWAPALQARAVQPHFSHCLSAQHPRLFTKPEPSALVKCF